MVLEGTIRLSQPKSRAGLKVLADMLTQWVWLESHLLDSPTWVSVLGDPSSADKPMYFEEGEEVYRVIEPHCFPRELSQCKNCLFGTEVYSLKL